MQAAGGFFCQCVKVRRVCCFEFCFAVDRYSAKTVEDNEDYLGTVFLDQVLYEFLHSFKFYWKEEKLFKLSGRRHNFKVRR